MIIGKNSLAIGNRTGTIIREGNGDETKIDTATVSSSSPMLSLYMTSQNYQMNGDLEYKGSLIWRSKRREARKHNLRAHYFRSKHAILRLTIPGRSNEK